LEGDYGGRKVGWNTTKAQCFPPAVLGTDFRELRVQLKPRS
jgi:hypothetical protein